MSSLERRRNKGENQASELPAQKSLFLFYREGGRGGSLYVARWEFYLQKRR
jgi:hypothetical protein